MVGRTMIDRTSEPASHEKPGQEARHAEDLAHDRQARDDLLGERVGQEGHQDVMPSQPQTTLGMPTKISRAGWTMDLAQLGATSDRNRARPTESGVEIKPGRPRHVERARR
jgi:hypothetical protein